MEGKQTLLYKKHHIILKVERKETITIICCNNTRAINANDVLSFCGTLKSNMQNPYSEREVPSLHHSYISLEAYVIS